MPVRAIYMIALLFCPAHGRPHHCLVNGFNPYYGVVRGDAHKWLNLQRFFSRMPQTLVLRLGLSFS